MLADGACVDWDQLAGASWLELLTNKLVDLEPPTRSTWGVTTLPEVVHAEEPALL
jgi:hypothetical protein